MPSRQSSSSSSSSSLLAPNFSSVSFVSLLSLPLLRISRSATGKSKEEKGYTTRIVCTTLSDCRARTSRLHEQPSLYLFSFTVIHSIHNTYTDPGTCLSNKNWERLPWRGAFALVFRYFVFIKKESLHPCAFLLLFIVYILNCSAHCLFDPSQHMLSTPFLSTEQKHAES
jgi:hypothetical protein